MDKLPISPVNMNEGGIRMNYNIIGTAMPAVEIELYRDETVYTQTAAVSWMTGEIQITTEKKNRSRKGLGRFLTGESLFITTHKANSDDALIGFSTPAPGEIFPIVLETYKGLICRKEAFLCAENTVTLDTVFTRQFTNGLFGSEGLTLQEMSGSGIVFLDINGCRIEKTLAAGEVLKVSTGNVAAFEKTVSYKIEKLRGKDVFLACLTGPGRVILQTQNFSAFCGQIKNSLSLS